MKRVASQLVFCSPECILRDTIVEQNDDNTINRLISLHEQPVELSQTVFFDGIISGDIISLKKSGYDYANIPEEYHLINLYGNQIDQIIIAENKIPVFDFGTEDIQHINKVFSHIVGQISELSIFDIIAACTFYPALICNKNTGIHLSFSTRLIHWQDCNLVTKRITIQTQLSIL